jgi:hypothetical protein
MNFNLEDFEPKPTTWLKTRVEYVGIGRAVFEDPAGVIKGQARAIFHENGDYSIEMNPEEVEGSNLLPNPRDSIMHILTGQEPVKRGENYIWGSSFPTKENICSQFTITTSEGIFSATGKINYYHFWEKQINFLIVQAHFEVAVPCKKHYWVLPLSNFIANFTQSDQSLDQHPLRIYPTPFVSEALSQRKDSWGYIYANQKNNLIIFEYSKRLAFIEALSDYKERVAKLTSGQEINIITSVMVGEVDPSDLEQNCVLKPSNFLPFLGLASGSHVGSPWIELYDKQGNLNQRIHRRLNLAPYRKGHVVLHNHIGKSKIGELLTFAQSSQGFTKDYVLLSTSLAIESGFSSFNIVDALTNLFRAFDILCKEYGIRQEEYLVHGIDKIYQDQIRKIFENSRTEIQKIASSIIDVNLYPQKRNIEEVAKRVFVAWEKVNKSGLAITKLLDKLDFQDANILDRHYASNPRPDERSWFGLLSYCRGVGVHDIRIEDGYLNDLLIVKDHLYDILIRIIFYFLGYQGAYTPIFAQDISAEVLVSWVDADLPASRLGYK